MASATTTVTFTDALPYINTNPGVPYATLASAFAAPAGWTCTTPTLGTTGTISCSLNSGQTLAVGAVVKFPLVVKVPSGTASGTTLINAPHIASTGSAPVSDPIPQTIPPPSQRSLPRPQKRISPLIRRLCLNPSTRARIWPTPSLSRMPVPLRRKT